MGELGALFNPGMRHELEERQAKAARREEEGNAKDGDLRIDLESGVAVINVSGDEDGTGLPQSDSTSADAQQESQSAKGDVPGAADEPAATRAAGSTSPSRPARPVKNARSSAATEKPALAPRGKRGAAVTR